MTPPGGNVFLPIRFFFELDRHFQKTHVLTKFHLIQRLDQICDFQIETRWLELVGTSNNTNRKFEPSEFEPSGFDCIHTEKTAPPPGGHIVTSRVFRRNTTPLPGGHVFQQTGTIFELNQHII
ncbi:hypothetical protein DPMN_131275 [Dreissena polymorpha]|uniref:Uncharacterized protein n=1 Tax=Dreissena polymorpha TaxID=45954 RepID=A0A9D4JYB6_DREPO|nr:hypothetical protein DPMN_131275 [Dreissena polymorpha]